MACVNDPCVVCGATDGYYGDRLCSSAYCWAVVFLQESQRREKMKYKRKGRFSKYEGKDRTQVNKDRQRMKKIPELSENKLDALETVLDSEADLAAMPTTRDIRGELRPNILSNVLSPHAKLVIAVKGVAIRPNQTGAFLTLYGDNWMQIRDDFRDRFMSPHIQYNYIYTWECACPYGKHVHLIEDEKGLPRRPGYYGHCEECNTYAIIVEPRKEE